MAFWFRAGCPLEVVKRLAAGAFDFHGPREAALRKQPSACAAVDRLHADFPSNVAPPPEAGGAGYPVRGSDSRLEALHRLFPRHIYWTKYKKVQQAGDFRLRWVIIYTILFSSNGVEAPLDKTKKGGEKLYELSGEGPDIDQGEQTDNHHQDRLADRGEAVTSLPSGCSNIVFQAP